MGTAISDILDYVENPEKTDGGKLITSYQCSSKIADAEFLFSKRQYQAKTGRRRGADDVIAYKSRDQSIEKEHTYVDVHSAGHCQRRRGRKNQGKGASGGDGQCATVSGHGISGLAGKDAEHGSEHDIYHITEHRDSGNKACNRYCVLGAFGTYRFVSKFLIV